MLEVETKEDAKPKPQRKERKPMKTEVMQANMKEQFQKLEIKNLFVGPKKGYKTIQSAIDYLGSNGGIIELQPGTYTGNGNAVIILPATGFTLIGQGNVDDIVIDGEMQANVALSDEARAPYADFTTLDAPANVLIFPSLGAGNIAYKLLGAMSAAELIGPIVLGMHKPVNVIPQDASVDTIVHITAITVARIEGER